MKNIIGNIQKQFKISIDCTNGNDVTAICMYGEQAETVIAILEKQIPKKVECYDVSWDFSYHYAPSWRCICKSDVSKGSKYCSQCGQKLEW